MRGLLKLSCVCISILILKITDSSCAVAQQVRVAKSSESPDQWSISYSRKLDPDAFEFDSVHSSQDDADKRIVALRVWSTSMVSQDYDLKLAVILVTAERKLPSPVPDPPDTNAPKTDAIANATTTAPTSTSPAVANTIRDSVVAAPPVFSKFKNDVNEQISTETPRIAGRRAQGTLGTTKVIVEFDGDGDLTIKSLDDKPLSSGTWFQKEAELTFATASWVYVGNVGNERAKGLRMANGPRLGLVEEPWNLTLAAADPIVGTWQLATRNERKNVGELEAYYTTKLVFKLDHTVNVEWTQTSKRIGSNVRERVTDFDRSTANWEVREGKIYFSNPKIIRNWHGKDIHWSWFDPKFPLSVEGLKTWERVK